MRGLQRRAIITLVAALATLTGITAVAEVSAESGTPAIAATSAELEVGSIGKVSVKAVGIDPPGLGAWTIDVAYDPEVVAFISCAPQQGGVCNHEFAAKKVRITGTSVAGLPGTFDLASYGIACKQAGESDLIVQISTLADATIGDPRPINAKADHGVVVCTEHEPGKDPTPTPTPKPGDPPPGSDPKNPGDANCDGVVNSIDAALVLQQEAGLKGAVPCPDDADKNHDGSINSIDAALILQQNAGLI